MGNPVAYDGIDGFLELIVAGKFQVKDIRPYMPVPSGVSRLASFTKPLIFESAMIIDRCYIMLSGVRELARGSPGNQPSKVPMPAPRGPMRSMEPVVR